MIKKIILLFIFIISEISCLNSYCEEGENHCLKCNPLTKLCYKCDLAIFEPDELGGCQPLIFYYKKRNNNISGKEIYMLN